MSLRTEWTIDIPAMLAGLLLALVMLPARVLASDVLWEKLKAGGQVVLMRHAITTPGVGDPPGMRLDDCASQRNLTDDGRRDARRTGEAFRARAVTVERLLSSPWCRCLETARLAFGVEPQELDALSNLFGRPDNRTRQVDELEALVSKWQGKGNLVLVSHGSTIAALTGVSPEPAEMVIATPRFGGKFVIAGRLLVESR